MEDFPLLDVIIEECKFWLKNFDGTGEPCAVVLLKKGKAKLVPLANVSDDPENYFLFDKQFVSLSLTGDILYTVHAHPDNCIPSDHDIDCCNKVNIPYIIFNAITLDYSIIYPEGYKNLLGRSYKFGTQDCFEACRDWYIAHSIVLPSRDINWIDDWWLKGLNYIEEEISNWPFKEVSSLRYGDLLTFGEIPNHIGIYIEKDIFFHHAVNRLSCKENIYPFWGSTLKKVYRYEKSDITRVSWR
jgi:proteasome lid subunit RPN8/RPN11